MIRKMCISIITLVGLVLLSATSVVGVGDAVVVTDSIGDVSQYNSTINEIVGTYDVPNIDIKEAKAEKNGDSVTITLTINENGQFEKLLSYYGIFLFTTSPSLLYMIIYTGMAIGDEVGSDGFLVTKGYGEEIIEIDSSSIEDNVMTLSFKLDDNDERIIGLYAATTKDPGGEYSYSDDAPEGFEDEMMSSITPHAGGTYNSSTDTPVTLQATLEEGEPSDYEWLWVFHDEGVTLEGANPSHTFKIPDTYNGIVYVFDGEGNWGYDEFTVEVNGTVSNGGNGDDNGSPGFEIIIIFAAIAVVLIGAIIVSKRR